MVQHHPSNAGGGGGACHLRETGSARRLKYDGVRTRGRRTLNELQQLLALRHGVVVGVNDLYVHAQTPRRAVRSGRLLLLIIVAVIRERDQEVELLHGPGTLYVDHSPSRLPINGNHSNWVELERGKF